MERIPTDLICMYGASSIADMLDSYPQVAQDEQEAIASRPYPLRISSSLDSKANQLIAFLLRKQYKPTARALVFIPVVRHYPDQDTSPNHDKITIQDPTAQCEVELPTNPLAIKFFEEIGCNLPADNIKRLSWCSDVLLAAHFNFWQDTFTLLHISNRLSPDASQSQLFALMQKLALRGMRV